MGHRFAELAFTPNVKAIQEALGSRRSYSRMESGEDSHHALGPQEAAFIAERDSFYMATVSETGWPYVQHRGGPRGFVRVLDDNTLAFADFRGNRQYVSVGNLAANDRVCLFFMDYPNRTRLKLLGRAKPIALDEAGILSAVALPDYDARVERGVLIRVEAFDWNCPQHITPRYTVEEVEQATAGYAAPRAGGPHGRREPARARSLQEPRGPAAPPRARRWELPLRDHGDL